MTKKSQILVVGAGVMGANHARAVAQSGHSELAGIVETDSKRGSWLAEKYGAPLFPELPSLKSVDGVIVATPTESHFGIGQQVLESGVALLLEKPLTDELASSQKLVDFAIEKQLPLMCGFLERFNPAFLTVSNLVRDPLSISATRHSPYTARVKTGVCWDLLVHDVDLILRISPDAEVRNVSGEVGFFHPLSGEGSEDVVECLFSLSSGLIAHASASRMGHRKIRSMSITESDRVFEVDLLRRSITTYRNIEERMMDDPSSGYRQEAVIEIPEIKGSNDPLDSQLAHFRSLILGSSDPEAEIETILPSHRLVSSIKNNR